MENQAKQKAEREAGKAILKAELDHVVEEKNAEQLRKAEQSSAEDRSIEIFLKAKKVYISTHKTIYIRKMYVS